MKKTRVLIGFLSFCFLSLSVSTLAQPSLNSLHATKHEYGASKNTTRAANYFYATDIHVWNTSYWPITVKVPGCSIYDTLYYNEVFDFTSDEYFDAVLVVLYDDTGYEFYRDYVPNHTTLKVKDWWDMFSTGGKKHSKVQATIEK